MSQSCRVGEGRECRQAQALGKTLSAALDSLGQLITAISLLCSLTFRSSVSEMEFAVIPLAPSPSLVITGLAIRLPRCFIGHNLPPAFPSRLQGSLKCCTTAPCCVLEISHSHSVCMHVCTSSCACRCTWRPEASLRRPLSRGHSSWVLRQGLSLGPGACNLVEAGWPTSRGSFCFYFPLCPSPHLPFYTCAGLNTGLQDLNNKHFTD